MTSWCNARWSTDFSDPYYGVEARCNLQSGHDASDKRHHGPMVIWDGPDRMTTLGVYATWYDESIGASRDTPEAP